jgi:hypothetical protein|tara:strand:+ start:23 stop:172 length:150 start_codon:yes stop_codon:yes gene_type:complete
MKIAINGFEQDSEESNKVFKKIMGMLDQIKEYRLENPGFEFTLSSETKS